MNENYDDLYRAIGRVVYEWAWLENAIASLVFDLSALQSPNFYEDAGVGRVATVFNANLDVRTNITIAQNLAHDVRDTPGFFEKVEAALNPIANEMRNERNRFVHDSWFVTGGRPHRIKTGSRVRRESGSGAVSVELNHVKTFEAIADVHAFADRIHRQHMVVINLGDEAQALFQQRYPEVE